MALRHHARDPMNQSRPVYLKLRDRIAAAIIEGKYAEGDMLPSVRVLASEQGANPLTVAKAYQQFQIDGLVERSEEHTSELQSLMRISYAVFCLKKKKININK